MPFLNDADEQHALVRAELTRRGLNYPRLCRGPCGSRDLLLAFGWLLSTEDLIERFMFASSQPSSPSEDPVLGLLTPSISLADPILLLAFVCFYI